MSGPQESASRFVSLPDRCPFATLCSEGDEKMDQQRIGAFLRQLRKERALTQEQLAEHFGVSGRTVSRWENGNNLPDLALLVELADYYDVEIRELFDGERKLKTVNPEEKETLFAAAEYTNEEKSRLLRRIHLLFLVGLAGFVSSLVVWALGLENTTPYEEIASMGQGMAFGMMFLGALFTSRHAASIQRAKRRLIQKRKP